MPCCGVFVLCRRLRHHRRFRSPTKNHHNSCGSASASKHDVPIAPFAHIVFDDSMPRGGVPMLSCYSRLAACRLTSPSSPSLVVSLQTKVAPTIHLPVATGKKLMFAARASGQFVGLAPWAKLGSLQYVYRALEPAIAGRWEKSAYTVPQIPQNVHGHRAKGCVACTLKPPPPPAWRLSVGRCGGGGRISRCSANGWTNARMHSVAAKLSC